MKLKELFGNKDFYRLLVSGAFFGIIAGAILVLFFQTLYGGIHLIWDIIPGYIGFRDSKYKALIICGIGGLLVGLGSRFYGNIPVPFQKSLKQFNETGKFDYKDLPKEIINAFLPLFFGGSVGPEAGLIGILGGSGSWFGVMFGKRIDLSKFDFGKKGKNISWLIIPAIPAITTLFFTVKLIDLPTFTPIFDKGAITSFYLKDLVICLVPALFGMIAGYIYMLTGKLLRGLFSLLAKYPVISGVVGGIGMGICGCLLPLTLFSGQHEIHYVIKSAGEEKISYFLILALANIVVSQFVLAAGWKGGPFFPIFFSGASVGIVAWILFPGISLTAAIVAGLTGMTTIKMPKPGAVILFCIFVCPIKMAGIILISTLSIYYIDKSIRKRIIKGKFQLDRQ